MTYSVDDIVGFAVTKDHLALKAAVDDVLSQRAADAIDAEKQLVGQEFGSNETEEQYDEED
jgi:hypothetical protein